jgi:hypothetical protein
LCNRHLAFQRSAIVSAGLACFASDNNTLKNTLAAGAIKAQQREKEYEQSHGGWLDRR